MFSTISNVYYPNGVFHHFFFWIQISISKANVTFQLNLLFLNTPKGKKVRVFVLIVQPFCHQTVKNTAIFFYLKIYFSSQSVTDFIFFVW